MDDLQLESLISSQSGPGAGGGQPGMYEARMQQIQNMPPGPQKEAALAGLLRDYEGEQGRAEEQRSLGAEMMMSEAPQGTHTGGKYGTYVAANPLEHMASALRQYQGGKMIKDSREAGKVLSGQQEDARRRLFTAGMGGTPVNIYHQN